MIDKSLAWLSPYAPSPVSRLALCAGMPPRDLKREAELTKRAREMAAHIKREQAWHVEKDVTKDGIMRRAVSGRAV